MSSGTPLNSPKQSYQSFTSSPPAGRSDGIRIHLNSASANWFYCWDKISPFHERFANRI